MLLIRISQVWFGLGSNMEWGWQWMRGVLFVCVFVCGLFWLRWLAVMATGSVWGR